MRYLSYIQLSQLNRGAIYFSSILILLFTVSNLSAQSLSYKLATIDRGGYVSKNDLTVKRFNSLLNQLSVKFVEDKERISDMTVKAKQILRDNGIDQRMLKMMEGINSLFYQKIANQKYSEYLSVYVTLRVKGKSHNEAIEGLRNTLDLMDVH